MRLSEAASILGLAFAEIHNESKIKQAWKQKIRETHPDKYHTRQEDATKATQRLNEAKDTLLEKFTYPYEKKLREDEEECVLSEKQQERRRAEDAQFEQKCGEMYDKMKAAYKRERHNNMNKKKKRLPTTRVHRNINDYQEGKALVEEMKRGFKEMFEEADASSTLMVGDILDLFIKSRDHHTTDLETNLFKRHSKKLFIDAWPKAAYSSFKNKRCFRHVCAKQ